MLDGVDTVEPFVVVLDGLQIASDLDALGEVGLCGFKDLVADAVVQAGQKKLMLDEFEGVVDSFSFIVSRSTSGGGSDGSHGGGLCICKALVSHLDAVGVIIDRLIIFLS